MIKATIRRSAAVDCRVLALLIAVSAAFGQDALTAAEPRAALRWRHLSSTTGDLAIPTPGKQQTASLVLDVDRDGLKDFVITERTQTPSVVWFRRSSAGWKRYVVDATALHIEAGGSFCDIDRDGDADIVFGGDSRSNQVWWWENPRPDYVPKVPWKRRVIKSSGGNKHHDQIFGDFDGDGQFELVFWNQGDRRLCIAEIPGRARQIGQWPHSTIYSWKSGPECEGLAKADIDGDGKLDIIGGGNWYRHEGGTSFSVHPIDAGRRFTRSAAGQLVKGGRPEVVIVPGDADGPLDWYQWESGSWRKHNLVKKVIHGHSLDVADINGDGNLDIFSAEMRLSGGNPNAKVRVFLGDGGGKFTKTEVASGCGNHESRIADLDGDGDIDILGKPYNWQTPRLDIWLNNSAAGRRK